MAPPQRKSGGIERLTHGVERITFTADSLPQPPRAQPGRQEPLVESSPRLKPPETKFIKLSEIGLMKPQETKTHKLSETRLMNLSDLKVIRSAQDLHELSKNDSAYREAAMLQDEIKANVGTLKDQEKLYLQDQEWKSYIASVEAGLGKITDKITDGYSHRTKERYFKTIRYLAQRASGERFENSNRLNDFVALLYAVEDKNKGSEESAKRMRIAMLNVIYNIIIDNNFNPYMITNMRNIITPRINGTEMIGKFRLFASYLNDNKLASRKRDMALLYGLASTMGYTKKSMEYYATHLAEDPIANFESADRLKEELADLRESISNLIDTI